MTMANETIDVADLPEAGAADPKDRLRGQQRRVRLAQAAIPGVVVLLMIAFQAKNSAFLTGDNIQTILESAALPAVVACGLTVVLILGQFDLSIQAMAGLATTATAVYLVNHGLPLGVTFVLVLVIAMVVGLFNGVLVAYLGANALVVTIAVGSLLNGSEFALSNSKPTPGIPSSFTEFARSDIASVPTMVVIALLVAVVLWFFLDRTATGREMRAIGGNVDAARFSGINVKRLTCIGFMVTAVVAALAGFLYTGRQGVVYPMTGLQVLLQSFAACFLGAAMFRVGEFNIPGTVVGVLMAEIVINGLLLADVADYATYFFQGAILVAAIVFARFVAGGRAEE